MALMNFFLGGGDLSKIYFSEVFSKISMLKNFKKKRLIKIKLTKTKKFVAVAKIKECA